MTHTDTASSLTLYAERALGDALRAALRGEVIDRDHAAYDEARRVWNGLIDRHPAVIARCADVADVVEAVRVARDHRPVTSIRGGGHQVAGSAVCDDGLVIDLSAMRSVHVDATARTARVQAGATWGEVDRATQVHGLATPGGEVSVTGVAGLTLGGGLGVMMRTHGLSCDNLRSVEIVTADGMVRTASRDEHTDLFWAVRGGGRGLGVVTSLEFDLHPLGPDVAAALVLYPYEDAVSVLRAWRDAVRRAPDTLAPEIGLWSIPPLPDVPDELHGSPIVMVAGVHIGPPAEAGPVLAPLQQLGRPLADMTGTMPYVESQSAVDELFPDGARYYWKSHFVDEMTDELIDTLVALDADRPSPESVIMIRTLGGAIGRVGDDETAYPHRSARFNVSVDASWQDPAARRHRHRLGEVDLGRHRSRRDRRRVPQLRRSWRRRRPSCRRTRQQRSPGRGDPPCLRPRRPLRRSRTPAMSPSPGTTDERAARRWRDGGSGDHHRRPVDPPRRPHCTRSQNHRGGRGSRRSRHLRRRLYERRRQPRLPYALGRLRRWGGVRHGAGPDRGPPPLGRSVRSRHRRPRADSGIAERLHRLGWPTTTLAAYGPQRTGHRDLHRGRRHPAEELIDAVRQTAPDAFWTVQPLGTAHASVLPVGYLQIAS